MNYVSEDRIDTVSEADRGILFQAKAAFVTSNDSEEVLLAEDDCKEVFIAEKDFKENCPKDGFVTLSDGTSTALDNTVVTFSYSALEAESSKAISDGLTKSSKVTSGAVTETSKATSDNAEIANLVLVFVESKHQSLQYEAQVGDQLCARLLLGYY